jgi:CheY-like chemotaxis protein
MKLQPAKITEDSMKTCDENPVNKPVRVLVVEDDSDDSDLLVRQLQKNNFEGCVKIIPDGRQAWNYLMAENLSYDLIAIFLDLNLPSLNGVKLLRKIKSRHELNDIPVFIMTSSNSPRDLDECARLGVDGYITKPVTYLAFAKAVADFFHAPSAHSYARME